ncbi:hypothetical protein [Pseudoxanthomonas japonensis]|uniref:hypothetical protein n=1 Tax=Pseudoxanthomonas japonensis TaxID=69284 RepID=UPI00139081E4|nr:hypothetical protein [Pseudoxanthomonas japonensis]
MKKRNLVVTALFGFSGLAVACNMLPLPIPPLPISVSATDVAKAMMNGFSPASALHAAAMTKMDSYAGTAVGKDVWKANNFVGYLNYRGPMGGAGMVFIDKPCDKTAEDVARERQNSTNPATPGSGSGGGGGGGPGYGGSPGAPGCVYGCGNPIVDVGDLEQA